MLHMKEQEGPAGEAAQEGAAAGAEKTREDDRLVRLQADFENFKKRAAKEAAESAARGKRGLLLKLLNLSDTFDLAIAAMSGTKDAELLKGVKMMDTHLKEMLSEEGIAAFGEEGDAFDPFRHDALGQVDAAGGTDAKKDETVAEVIQRGYLWKGAVLRHAAVKVLKIGKEAEGKKE